MRVRAINVTVHPIKGKDIREVCGDVKELSEFLGREIIFEFNGVTIYTDNKSIVEMYESYIKVR